MSKNKPLLTIVIPLKNTKEYHREPKRLRDCLRSLQGQGIPFNQIDVIVSDTGSDAYYKRKHREICNKFKVRHVYFKTDDEVWNISLARNIGIRNARADYVMTTDVDCVFAPNFVETALKYVGERRLIHCRISDLPVEYDGKFDNFLWMNKLSTLRPSYGYGGCQIFSKKWAEKVRGFDEDYKGWGADDTDFYLRAKRDNLKILSIEEETSFFHQWHSTENRDANRPYVHENRLRLKLVEYGKLPIARNDSGWGMERKKSVPVKAMKGRFKDVAILITTFMRDAALFNCVKSIRRYYPGISIFVTDNGKSNPKKSRFCEEFKCTYIKAPYDCGVGASRNFAFKKIGPKYKFVMVCEDDIIFTDETRLDNWRVILESNKAVGIVGGVLNLPDRKVLTVQHYEAWMYAKAAVLYVEKIEQFDWRRDREVVYALCDIVLNIFMMRREVWADIKWDEKIRSAPEHEDFFFSLKKKTDWKVAFTDKVSMLHRHVRYEQDFDRNRADLKGFGYFSRKWGIEYIHNSWHKDWGKPNPMRIGILDPPKKDATAFKKKEIAIGIKTFLREESLFKTLEAIKEHFPFSYRLYIADDGDISDEKEYRYQKLEVQGHIVIRLPRNSGISVGRNEIIRKSTEPYVLIMDDDVTIEDGESIENMKAVLDSDKEIGLCSGILYTENGDFYKNENYQKGLRFEIDRGLLFRYPAARNIRKANGAKFVLAEQVVNFFLARREVFDEVMWDSQIKVELEHMDFFLRLKKTKWKAAACLDARATHLNMIDDFVYNQHRWSVPQQYFLNKHHLSRTIVRFN